MLQGMEPVAADADLMLAYRDGDATAFDRLYARYRGPVYRYLARQAAPAAVDDLFQEVWIRIIRTRKRYRPNAPFSAYLFRIAHNVLVDHYRRTARTPRGDGSDPDLISATGPDPVARHYDQRVTADQLKAAIQGLPADQRDAFLLHEEGGLTLEQIGAITGVGRETVKSRLRYAVARLREYLGRTDPIPEGRPS
jgi:RNA polymerase sigma-70 factor (ECF subfamily)